MASLSGRAIGITPAIGALLSQSCDGKDPMGKTDPGLHNAGYARVCCQSGGSA